MRLSFHSSYISDLRSVRTFMLCSPTVRLFWQRVSALIGTPMIISLLATIMTLFTVLGHSYVSQFKSLMKLFIVGNLCLQALRKIINAEYVLYGRRPFTNRVKYVCFCFGPAKSDLKLLALRTLRDFAFFSVARRLMRPSLKFGYNC